MNPAYIRVSTTDQKDHGVGLDAQKQAICEAAAREGLLPIQFYQDDASGSSPIAKRPGLSAALAAMDRGGVLLVHARDRLARSVDVMAGIRDAVRGSKGRIYSVAEGFDPGAGGGAMTLETASRRLSLGVQDVVSEFNRLQIVARVQAGMAECIRAGRFTGNVPYGWDAEVVPGVLTRHGKPMQRLISNEAEQRIIAKMKRWRGRGLGYHRIAGRLNKLQIPTKRGSIWRTEQVKSVLLQAARPERRQHVTGQA